MNHAKLSLAIGRYDKRRADMLEQRRPEKNSPLLQVAKALFDIISRTGW